jgi:hypothetical protein
LRQLVHIRRVHKFSSREPDPASPLDVDSRWISGIVVAIR